MNFITRTGMLLLAAVAAMFTFCGCKTTSAPTAASKTDTAVFADSAATRVCRVSIEYPTDTTTLLAHSFGEYVSESFGDTYRGSILQADSMAAYYGAAMNDSLKSMVSELQGLTSSVPQLADEVTLRKIYETPQLITFERDHYSYTGGAHGSHLVSGITFRKSDGRRFGSDMLINTSGTGFTELIKDGLKGYFSRNGMKVTTDDDLNNCLLGVHAYDLPLPQFPPYLTRKGVTFVYQQYEIACYAAGIPNFTIPYDQIKPYLSRAVREALNLR
jgi:hypothetical protein